MFDVLTLSWEDPRSPRFEFGFVRSGLRRSFLIVDGNLDSKVLPGCAEPRRRPGESRSGEAEPRIRMSLFGD